MSARVAASLLALALTALARSASGQASLPDGPPKETFLAACEGKDGWEEPSPPVRIFGNVYHVGTCGITALLVASDAGHVLLDTGTAGAAPLVAGNIEALGFDLADVEWIVTSHEHFDHAGGIAELKRRTGAQLASSPLARRPLETGKPDWRDPQAESLDPFEGAPVERVMRDGEHLVLGPIDLTIHTTPGHAPGSTTWSWRSCEGEVCRNVVYADSVSAVSADEYRFSQQATYVDAFARSLGKIAALPCEILITPHPSASKLRERLAGTQPMADPEACLNYALAAQSALEARLASENPNR
jgi:metallo-beta-lactamase class B